MEDTEAFPEHERPVDAWCDPEMLHVRLADERTIRVPILWYPFLLNATRGARATVEMQPDRVCWPDMDEGISVKSMLMGWKAPGPITNDKEVR